MLRNFFDKRGINRITALGMIVVVAVCLRPPDVVLLKRISSHATQIMMLFLLVGMFFLIINQKRLLFTAFGCSAALCLYFKYVANISLNMPVKTSEPTVTVMQSSASELGEDWEVSLNAILQKSSDVICFLELTPDWEEVLRSKLGRHYPNHAELTRIDFYGMAIYTKYEIMSIDTVYYEDIPTLQAKIRLNADHEVCIFTSNTNPPLFRRSFEQLRNQLDAIAINVVSSSAPSITTGNYNLDQFSEELQNFRAYANLNDSRRSISPSLNPPTHHMFFSNQLECLSFTNIYDSLNNKVGIFGEYQLKSDADQIVRDGR